MAITKQRHFTVLTGIVVFATSATWVCAFVSTLSKQTPEVIKGSRKAVNSYAKDCPFRDHGIFQYRLSLLNGDGEDPERMIANEVADTKKVGEETEQKHSIALLLQEFAEDMERLSELCPNDPVKDPSAPWVFVSAGSSYTRLWSPETWRKHGSPPHVRYIRHVIRWPYSTTARIILPAVLGSVVWSFIVSIVLKKLNPGMQAVSGFSTVISFLSAPLALILTLRANQSMIRLLEARTAWGRLVLLNRSLANLASIHLWDRAPQATLLLARHAALFGWMLKAYVRGESQEQQYEILATLLKGEDLEWVATQPRATTALLARMRQIINSILHSEPSAESRDPNWKNSRSSSVQLTFEDRLMGLEQVAGVCDFLLTSPIPPTYSRHLSRTIFLWLLCMPWAVGSNMNTLTLVLASAATSYVLIGIDEVGMEIEPCFNLLPLQQLAANAQNVVRDTFILDVPDGTGGKIRKPNDMPPVPPR